MEQVSKYISEGASKNAVQFPSHAVDTPKILTHRQLRITAPNCINSGVVTLQLNTENVFSHFVIWISLSLLSYCNGSQAYKIRKQAAAGLKSHITFKFLETLEIIRRVEELQARVLLLLHTRLGC
jgi:hypothetical protein